MKRHGNLWEDVISFESLLRAAEKARKGKRFRPAVAAFHLDQERALWALHEELAAKTYRPGAYRTFLIHEPKQRQISAVPYRDRVVHHALVGVLEPIFERTLPLVPKLLFGNAFPETPFRRGGETEFRGERSQTGVWERGGTGVWGRGGNRSLGARRDLSTEALPPVPVPCRIPSPWQGAYPGGGASK